ncbi:MAG: DUF494 family protein [Pseudomonadota bacterium]
MKQPLIDILAYLIHNYNEHYIGGSTNVIDTDLMADNMLAAGFHPSEVDFTVNWLADLKFLQRSRNRIKAPKKTSMRILSPAEKQRINEKAIDYLFHLESLGVIDARTREIVLDQALAQDDIVTIGVTEIKWMTMMALINKPTSQKKLVLISELVFNENVIGH